MARAFRSPQIEVLPRRQLRRIHSVARFGTGRLRVGSDNGPDFGGAFNLYWLKSVFAAVALLAGLSCGSGTSSLPPAGEPMTIPVPAPLADLAACAIPPRGATPTVVCAGNGLLPQQTLDIQAAINSSIANGVRLLLLPAGEYRLKKTLNIANAHDLVIDGQGVRLVFENALSNSDSRGLSISSARGRTLKNFSVDYDPLPYTQGRVIATSQSPTESIFDVQIDTGYRSDVPFFADSVAFKELSLRPFDAATLRIKRDGLRVIVSRVALLAPGILRFATTDPPVNLTNIAVGDLVATAAFRSSAIYLADSTGTQIDNVTVNTANGSSIEEVGGGGGTDARVCFKAGAPPPGASAQRLLARTRGGFNSRNVEKGPYIHDSFLERLGDDAIAVSGAVFSIPAIVGKTITFAAADPTLPIGLPPGSAVEIYDKNSLRVRIATTVAAVTPNSITLYDATGIGARRRPFSARPIRTWAHHSQQLDPRR